VQAGGFWRVTRLSGRGKACPTAAGFLSNLGHPATIGTQGFGLLGFASSKKANRPQGRDAKPWVRLWRTARLPKGRSSLEPLYAATVDNTLPHCRGEAPRYGTIGFRRVHLAGPRRPETAGAAPGEIRNYFSQSAAFLSGAARWS